MATAKRVGELQALSRRVAFWGSDLSLSYLRKFVAKTESVRNPFSQSFLVNPSPPVLIYIRQSQNVQSFDPSGSS